MTKRTEPTPEKKLERLVEAADKVLRSVHTVKAVPGVSVTVSQKSITDLQQVVQLVKKRGGDGLHPNFKGRRST